MELVEEALEIVDIHCTCALARNRRPIRSRCTFIILGKSTVRSMCVSSGFVNTPPVCPCCLVVVHGVSYKVSESLVTLISLYTYITVMCTNEKGRLRFQ